MHRNLKPFRSSQSQRGQFILGLIVGLLIGLVLSLAVAMYVNKVPLPFVDKLPQRTAEDDAAEIKNNQHWDPNAPLYGGNPAKAKVVAKPASQPVSNVKSTDTVPADSTSEPATDAASAPEQPEPNASDPALPKATDPAAILSGEKVSTEAPATALTYYVQTGAYSKSSEAEQQRAKITLLGFSPSISEREVRGRNMFRVRLGPFSNQEDAESARLALADNGIESALVRIQN